MAPLGWLLPTWGGSEVHHGHGYAGGSLERGRREARKKKVGGWCVFRGAGT